MSTATADPESESARRPSRLEAGLARIAPHALGMAVGIVLGAGLFAATSLILLRGGTPVGPHLQLLRWFFPGYTVSWTGAALVAVYGLAGGYLVGQAVARLRNGLITIYLRFARTRLAHHVASDLLDKVS